MDRIHAHLSQGQDTYTPTHSFEAGNWEQFHQTIKSICNSSPPTPEKSDFQFEFTNKAAMHNSDLIQRAEYDLKKAISNHNRFTTLTMGSELRPIHELDSLLSHHPSYRLFRWNSTHGIDYPAREIDEETRKEDLLNQLQKGNHKSALDPSAKEHVAKAMISDIELGYGIPITIECIKQLKHAEVYPVGLQHQQTINEHGKIIPKKRISHDLSNRRETGRSINQRVEEDLIPSVLYGYSLIRFLHVIHNIRYHNPNKVILCNKIDIQKAYRRLHTTPKIASKCIAVWPNLDGTDTGVLLTRLPFGSSPAPAHFSVGSDITCDLANDLTQCHLWDPKTLSSPLQHIIPPTKYLDDNTPFGIALKADVTLDPNMQSGTEGYIDDLGTAVLDTEDTKSLVERATSAVLMALHLQFRPHAGDLEPILRPETASHRKLLGEGGMAELIIFLGWLLHTRAFMIALPKEKAKAWSDSIKGIIDKTNPIHYQELATLVGRINHVAYY
jgi:hypothetical protein